MAVARRRKKLIAPWTALRRRLKSRWVADMSAPGARPTAMFDMMVVDHGLLRTLWSNRYEIDQGVWRGNQPDPASIHQLGRSGFRCVLNLRGDSEWSSYLLEREACREAGLRLVNFRLVSYKLPSPEEVLTLASMLQVLERPFLMHCKSGADRAGFASALYLLAVKGAPVEVALKQLSLRYMHLKGSPAGVQSLPFLAYAAEGAGMPFLDWVERRYNPEALQASHTAAPLPSFLTRRILLRE